MADLMEPDLDQSGRRPDDRAEAVSMPDLMEPDLD
jgi:hypothetical protein